MKIMNCDSEAFSTLGKAYLLFLKTNENGSNFWPHITYHHWFTHCPCHHEVLRLQDHINSVLTIIICIKRSVNSQEICYHKFSLKSIIWNYFSLILSFLFFFFSKQVRNIFFFHVVSLIYLLWTLLVMVSFKIVN